MAGVSGGDRSAHECRAVKGTDDKGEFVFTNLAPGSYTLVARPAAKIRLQDGVRVAAIATYYPSATDPALAVRIPVRTGQEVSGLEIKLVSVPVRRVTGVVLNEAGKPAAHAAVKLTSAGYLRHRLARCWEAFSEFLPGALPTAGRREPCSLWTTRSWDRQPRLKLRAWNPLTTEHSSSRRSRRAIGN